MKSGARQEYGEQLRLRKAGVPGELTQEATLVDAKPLFYADARLLVGKVQEVYASYRQSAPPYGLLDDQGEPFTGFSGRGKRPYLQLEGLLSSTARHAFEEVTPPSTGCPYHETLRNLGSISLNPEHPSSPDVERLREITFPGAELAPVTIVNILKRIPAIAELHGASADLETLARNSAHTLLREPLRHPQQLAKAFTFSIGEGKRGSDFMVDRDNFMPSDVIERYTRIVINNRGQEVIAWSIPTEDFTLRASVHVVNRLEGPEFELEGEHTTLYPIGTRLGDIEITEPTIGCPGNQLAYDMWDQAIDFIVGEQLWEQA